MEHIKEKITKLLRLANDKGATEAEAAQAMAMAAALMAKYGVEVSLREDGDDEATIRGDWFMGGDRKWHIIVGDTVCYLYFCKYVVRRQTGEFQFVGRPDVIAAAEMTFTWLVQQVERLYKECLPKGMSKAVRAEYRRTFKEACANRMRYRAWQILEALRNDDNLALEATGSKALVVKNAREQAINEAAEILKGQTKALTLKKSSTGIGTRFGDAAGQLVQLQHGVDNKAVKDEPLQLEHKK